MNIEQIDPSRVLISLCEKDMMELNVSYESLGLRDQHGRSVIKELLGCAERETGLSLLGKRLVIEALRYNSGCLLLVSISGHRSRKTYRIINRSDVYVYRFDGAEALICCCRRLCRSGLTMPRSSLSGNGGKYYLCLGCTLLSEKAGLILQEYASGRTRGRVRATAVSEQTRLITSDHAVEKLGGIMTSG